MKKVIVHENDVVEIILENEILKVHLLNVGASMFKFIYNDVDILVGPKEVKTFIKPDHYYGKTVGRFSGRLPVNFSAKGLKNINLEPYKGIGSTIHGGKNGFSTKKFQYKETTNNEAVFTLLQKEAFDNLPGDINLTVTYKLIGNELKVSYYATTTKTTILNITNHSYFNLDYSKTVLEHQLKIAADEFVLFDDKYNIKGLKEVENTIYDFREFVEIKKPLKELKNTVFGGLDTIFKYSDKKEVNLYSPKNKTNLEITTSYPA